MEFSHACIQNQHQPPPLFPDRLEEQARNRGIPYSSFDVTIPRFALLPELPQFPRRFHWLTKHFLYQCSTQYSCRGTASPCPRPRAHHARLSEYRTEMHPLPYRVVLGLARMELTMSLCSLQRAGWANGWKGVLLGQPTWNGQRDIPCHATSCSAIKNWQIIFPRRLLLRHWLDISLLMRGGKGLPLHHWLCGIFPLNLLVISTHIHYLGKALAVHRHSKLRIYYSFVQIAFGDISRAVPGKGAYVKGPKMVYNTQWLMDTRLHIPHRSLPVLLFI